MPFQHRFNAYSDKHVVYFIKFNLYAQIVYYESQETAIGVGFYAFIGTWWVRDVQLPKLREPVR